jgi:hypothetical protein
MPHVIAFFGTVSAGADNAPLNAVQGTAEYVQNNRHVLAQDQYVLWAYVQGISLTRARIDAPSLRAFTPPRLPYFRRGGIPGNEPALNDFAHLGLILRGAEEISVQTSNNRETGTETHYAVLCVGPTLSPPSRGPDFWVRATGNTTLVPNQWTNVPLTLESQLPAGNYRIVRFIARSATGIAARVITPGSIWRHGTICINAEGNSPHRHFVDGRYGDYGTFSTVALPSVEFLSSVADNAQEVYFGLVRA